MKKIGRTELNDLVKKITNKSENALGEYIFEDFKIQVRRKYALTVNERSKRLYAKRRDAGLCVVCGVKVTKKNPLTGKLYRACEKHHNEELAKKKKKRMSEKKGSAKTKKSKR